MFSIRKTIEVAGAHNLNLSYPSPCQNIHGHNWFVTVELSSTKLNSDGMIMDFKNLKSAMKLMIEDKLDHKNINEVVQFNPTAENMSKWICEAMDSLYMGTSIQCTSVEVQESRDNVAIYRKAYSI